MNAPSIVAGEARLFFEELEVASLSNVFCSDETYYASAHLQLDGSEGTRQREVVDFIRFNREWNRRCEETPVNPPKADEFSVYRRVIQTGKWRVLGASEAMIITEAPVFYGSNEVSWRCD